MKAKLKFWSPKWISVFAILTLTIAAGSTWASNGLQVIGPGPVSLSMGGAGVADPTTSNAVYINPAGVNGLGYQTDLSFTVAFPNTQMNSSINPQPAPVGNIAPAAFFPQGSIVFKAFGSDKVSLGVGAIPSAGFQVEYPVSRFPSAVTGNLYDKSGRYGNVKILPSFSVKVLDNLRIGASLDINWAYFSTDSATLGIGFPETMGMSRFDSSLGIGARIGLIYQPVDMLSIGAMYVFRSHFESFGRYLDLIPTGLDLPQQVHFGLAVKPMDGLRILTDFRWLNWSQGFLGMSLAQGGLGWRDQYTFAGGVGYDFGATIGFPLVLRVGYNYGASPITSATAFRNLVIPTITQHHLTTGISLNLSEYIGLDAAYIREFQVNITDNGSLNPVGAGSTMGANAHAFSVGVRGTWGKKKPPE